MKQFDKDQAMFMAQLGYVGLAVDLYTETEDYTYADRNPVVQCADGERAEMQSQYSRTVESVASDYVNMKDAKVWEYFMKMADPDFDRDADPMTVAQAQGFAHFRAALKHYNGTLRQRGHWRDLMAETLRLGKAHPSVHPDYAGAIGYCYGGQCVLEMVRSGADLQGVVSFHGLLQSQPLNLLGDSDFDDKVNLDGVVDRHATNCKVLIENAEHDDLVSPESIAAFTEEMGAASVDWQIHHHGGVQHGWALPPGVWATEYDELRDVRSTNNMLALFREVFPEHPPLPVPFNAAGASLSPLAVDTRLL
mmetsp:Transcript_29451/g.77182  ORF Transcript_29451/g.77182 Transcript_29451/m.77182 type:complete len:307 (+) Transcript_29451:33-953(+)